LSRGTQALSRPPSQDEPTSANNLGQVAGTPTLRSGHSDAGPSPAICTSGRLTLMRRGSHVNRLLTCDDA